MLHEKNETLKKQRSTIKPLCGLVARIRERSALLDGLFEQAPQALALLATVDLRVVCMNREFCRVFGYTPQGAQGRPLSELIIPGEFPYESRRITEMMLQGQRVDEETVRQRKDGSRLHVRLVCLVSTPKGHPAVYAMYSEITDRKAAEIALQALSIRLMEVQENERRYLARELHDEIGQLLTGPPVAAEIETETRPANSLKTRFEQTGPSSMSFLAVRALSIDLRPAELDQLGLLPALLASRITTRTEVLVDFKHQGAGRRLRLNWRQARLSNRAGGANQCCAPLGCGTASCSWAAA